MDIVFNEEQQSYIKSVADKYRLSRSEAVVFKEALTGKKNTEIAEKLCVAEKTIKFHLGNIFKKTPIKRKMQFFWLLNLWPVGLQNIKKS